MTTCLEKAHTSLSHKILCSFIAVTFGSSVILPPAPVFAQTVLNLPVPGTIVPPSPGFMPVLMTGLTIHPDNPLRFDFIMDTGHSGLDIHSEEFKQESAKLIKYFMASLTTPEEELWVNLSPYEKDRMIPADLGKTEMGRDMLAQDYLLKQLTASLMYPEQDLGKEFWKRVYQKAQEKFGTTEIPLNTFNKIWIVPEDALVYEQDGSAFVIRSKLAVMLEEDYEALRQSKNTTELGSQDTVVSGLQSQVVREVLIPEITKEINEGKNFANLRQIFNALILATWYKVRLKESLLGKVYVNQGKTKGIDVQDKEINEKIYTQYLEAFKKGVYNYIREDYDESTQQIIPRKYFSGGVSAARMRNGKWFSQFLLTGGLVLGLTAFSALSLSAQEKGKDVLEGVGNQAGVTAEFVENSPDDLTVTVHNGKNVRPLLLAQAAPLSMKKQGQGARVKGQEFSIDKDASSPVGNYYEVLGVARDAAPEEIKTAYRELAKKLHPDTNMQIHPQMRKSLEEQFKEINLAYEILSDVEKRGDYDFILNDGTDHSNFTGQQGTAFDIASRPSNDLRGKDMFERARRVERMREPEYIPILVDAFNNDTDIMVRESAAKSLARIGTREALFALTKLDIHSGSVLVFYMVNYLSSSVNERKNYLAIHSLADYAAKNSAVLLSIIKNKSQDAKNALTKSTDLNPRRARHIYETIKGILTHLGQTEDVGPRGVEKNDPEIVRITRQVLKRSLFNTDGSANELIAEVLKALEPEDYENILDYYRWRLKNPADGVIRLSDAANLKRLTEPGRGGVSSSPVTAQEEYSYYQKAFPGLIRQDPDGEYYIMHNLISYFLPKQKQAPAVSPSENYGSLRNVLSFAREEILDSLTINEVENFDVLYAFLMAHQSIPTLQRTIETKEIIDTIDAIRRGKFVEKRDLRVMDVLPGVRKKVNELLTSSQYNERTANKQKPSLEEVLKKFVSGKAVFLEKTDIILIGKQSSISPGSMMVGFLRDDVSEGKGIVLTNGEQTAAISGALEAINTDTLKVRTDTSIYEVKILRDITDSIITGEEKFSKGDILGLENSDTVRVLAESSPSGMLVFERHRTGDDGVSQEHLDKQDVRDRVTMGEFKVWRVGASSPVEGGVQEPDNESRNSSVPEARKRLWAVLKHKINGRIDRLWLVLANLIDDIEEKGMAKPEVVRRFNDEAHLIFRRGLEGVELETRAVIFADATKALDQWFQENPQWIQELNFVQNSQLLMDDARQVINLIDNFGDVLSGRGYSVTNVRVRQVVESSVRLFKKLHPETDLSVNISFRVPMDEVLTFENPFRSNLEELLLNAWKYGDRSKILLHLDVIDGTELEVRVTNFGVVLTSDEQKKVFNYGVRLDKSRDIVQGSGIGLFGLKADIESVGGRVIVESSEEKGTTFGFTMPMKSSSPVEVAVSLDGGARLQTSLNVNLLSKLWSPSDPRRKHYQFAQDYQIVKAQEGQLKLLGAPRWTKTRTPLSDVDGNGVDDTLGILDKIKELDALRKKEGEPQRIIRVLDWGAGEGAALIELKRWLDDSGISNVELIGYSDIYYRSWHEDPEDITFIFDVTENLIKHLGGKKIDLIYSRMGIYHYTRKALDREEVVQHFRGLKGILSPAGEIRSDFFYLRDYEIRTSGFSIMAITGKLGTKMYPIKDNVEDVEFASDGIRDTNNAPGGIDLNPALLDLQIKRDGNGVPLPLPMQPIENMHIDGFLPVIINIVPVTDLPFLLGLDLPTQQENPVQLTYQELSFAVTPARERFHPDVPVASLCETSGVGIPPRRLKSTGSTRTSRKFSA